MFKRQYGANLFAIVGATAVGAMIGIVTGLMIATKSGNELRQDILRSGRGFVKRGKKDDFDDYFDEEYDDDIDEMGDFNDTI